MSASLGVRVALQQGSRSHQLPGDAETALDRAVSDEGFLQRVEGGSALLSGKQQAPGLPTLRR